jgi:hypothetical protein
LRIDGLTETQARAEKARVSVSAQLSLATDGVAGMTQVAKFNNQPERFQCATEGGPTLSRAKKSSKPDENPANQTNQTEKDFYIFYTCLSRLRCMLLTTAVGGVGLNLTAADRVVLVDPVWLPRLLRSSRGLLGPRPLRLP